jgi:hypothetical protein
MVTSNGGGLLRKVPGPVEAIRRLFNAGANVIALDDYRGAGLVPRIRSALEQHTYEDFLAAEVWDTYEYPANPAGNPHTRRRPADRDLVFIEDITDATTGTHATFNNHAGCAFPRSEAAQGKRCAKPFRELSVRYDGGVAICCNDWRGVYKIGNVWDVHDINDLWWHPRMDAARRLLYHGRRVVGPCAGCDATSYRTGLLPDKKGRVELPVPTDQDMRIARIACAGRSMALPVLRPWEQ